MKGTGLDKSGFNSLHAMRMLAHMRQGQGLHKKAIEVLTKALEVANRKGAKEQRIDAQFLRGACHHALGESVEVRHAHCLLMSVFLQGRLLDHSGCKIDWPFWHISCKIE